MNVAESKLWLGLLPPADPTDAERLVATAVETGRPIDISSAPARWGGHMRGTDAFLSSFGGRELENATDQEHAVNLLHAELIQTLSSIGRDYLDMFFLTVRKTLNAHQVEGAQTALKTAKRDGSVKSCGLFVEAQDCSFKELLRGGVFEVLMTPDNPIQHGIRSSVEPIAVEKNIPLMSCRTLNWGCGVPFTVFTDDPTLAKAVVAQKARKGGVLVGVRSVEEIEQAIEAEPTNRTHSLDQELEQIAERYQDAKAWTALLDDERTWVREAAQRRAVLA